MEDTYGKRGGPEEEILAMVAFLLHKATPAPYPNCLPTHPTTQELIRQSYGTNTLALVEILSPHTPESQILRHAKGFVGRNLWIPGDNDALSTYFGELRLCTLTITEHMNCVM